MKIRMFNGIEFLVCGASSNIVLFLSNPAHKNSKCLMKICSGTYFIKNEFFEKCENFIHTETVQTFHQTSENNDV